MRETSADFEPSDQASEVYEFAAVRETVKIIYNFPACAEASAGRQVPIYNEFSMMQFSNIVNWKIGNLLKIEN